MTFTVSQCCPPCLLKAPVRPNVGPTLGRAIGLCAPSAFLEVIWGTHWEKKRTYAEREKTEEDEEDDEAKDDKDKVQEKKQRQDKQA